MTSRGTIAKGVKGKTYFVVSKNKEKVRTFRSLRSAKAYVRGKPARQKKHR